MSEVLAFLVGTLWGLVLALVGGTWWGSRILRHQRSIRHARPGVCPICGKATVGVAMHAACAEEIEC